LLRASYPKYEESWHVQPSIITTAFVSAQFQETVPFGPELEKATIYESTFAVNNESLLGRVPSFQQIDLI
jgi:hypothetical protein